MRKLIKLPSPALVIACIALFAAMTTAGYAGVKVGAAQIVQSSITGKHVKNKSLTKKDFKGKLRGPRGATGPAGATGQPGPAGPAGKNGFVSLTHKEKVVRIGGPGLHRFTVECPAGERPISFGGLSGADFSSTDVKKSRPNPTLNATGWYVEIYNGVLNPDFVSLHLTCAPVDQLKNVGESF